MPAVRVFKEVITDNDNLAAFEAPKSANGPQKLGKTVSSIVEGRHINL